MKAPEYLGNDKAYAYEARKYIEYIQGKQTWSEKLTHPIALIFYLACASLALGHGLGGVIFLVLLYLGYRAFTSEDATKIFKAMRDA